MNNIKKWLVDSRLVDKYGLCAAMVHDELLQKNILAGDWFFCSSQELALILPFNASRISRVIKYMEKDGLIIRKFNAENKRSQYKIKEIEEI